MGRFPTSASPSIGKRGLLHRLLVTAAAIVLLAAVPFAESVRIFGRVSESLDTAGYIGERGVERGCVVPRQMPSTQTLYGTLRCGLLCVVLHRSRPRRYPLRRLSVLAAIHVPVLSAPRGEAVYVRSGRP